MHLDFATPVLAAGLDVFVNAFSSTTVTVSIFGPSGLLTTTAIAPTFLNSVFIGVEDSGGITQIQLFGAGGWQTFADNVAFGGVVPEPASVALLALGLAGPAMKGRAKPAGRSAPRG